MVLDTIEIQDVRVLSATVFANMQARFRQEQERQAREAELAKERFMRREEAEAERLIDLTQLATRGGGAPRGRRPRSGRGWRQLGGGGARGRSAAA